MKKLFRRFKTDYVSVKNGKKCSKFTFFRYHFPLISIPSLLLAIILPPFAIFAGFAMIDVILSCPILLIKQVAKPLQSVRPQMSKDTTYTFKERLIGYLIAFGFFFLCAWVVMLFNLFICPWRLTLRKFDSKFVSRVDYEIYNQQLSELAA